MKIKRLYTLPEIISPISFTDGLNIILGEKNETNTKENSVGKSLSIEFINFALLKEKSHSRIALIPKEIFPIETKICIDFEIHGKNYTVHRSLEKSEEPTIFENGIETVFRKIDDASSYLKEKLFVSASKKYPSFRKMLSLLIRDERSEFKSLINCYDTKLRVPEDYAPHLYLFGIEIELYEEIKEYLKSIDSITEDISRIVESVRLIRKKDIDDARSDLNELDSEVLSIEKSIDCLENITGYEIIKNQIIALEQEIESYRRKKALLKTQIARLKPVSQKVDISTEEVGEFYNHIKMGLGDLISKNLKEVIGFKLKIDEFQNNLINDKRDSLLETLKKIDYELTALDKKYSDCISVLDQKGDLKNLKQTYAAFKEKSDQLSQLRSFVDRYDQLESDKQSLKSVKEAGLLKLQSRIQAQKDIINDFEKTLLDVHEFIQGNRSASFKIKHTHKKSVVEITMRIESDGGHSVEREKVFIYDISLLLNQHTQINHPGFLIHDNIFDVDQDTLLKNIQFLIDKAVFGKKQYILTLNSDRLDSSLLENLEPFIRARFTKNSRFLKRSYQEIQK